MDEFDRFRRLASRLLGNSGGGDRARLVDVTRLRGGTKKGVYRLSFEQGPSAVLYVWDEAEDQWPSEVHEATGPFAHASGLDYFEASHRLLTQIGVPTPRILAAEHSALEVDADVAFVTDAGDRSLADLINNDPAAAAAPMHQLANSLQLMRETRGEHVGKILPPPLRQPSDASLLGLPFAAPPATCQAIVLDRALADLDGAAHEITAVMENRDGIARLLDRAAEAIAPRDVLSVVHGELGPDHVLVDTAGQISIIDIEGLMYFDAEWEHAFLRIRFPSHYEHLAGDDLDPDRLGLYQLALHLSLVAGPLRLLASGFDDSGGTMRSIVDWNLAQVLAMLLA